VRAARVAVIGLDAEQRVAWGHAPGAARGAEPSSLLDVFAPGEASRLIELARRAAASGQSGHAELELVHGGEPRTYDFRIEPAAGGVVAIGFDVTPARLALATLVEADRRKDEFLATLSHELRTPLAPLRVALDLAKLAGHDPAQRARSLAIMERQVVQLTRLVDDLFDLSRIAHGKLELERALLDPVEVASAAVEAAAPMIEEHAHRLELRYPEAPVRVVGDFRRLVQAVTNLLANAAKYTPDGGRIDLELQVDPGRRVLAIRVRDTGIGISGDMLSSIFDIFVQSRDVHERARRGLGVGLHLVRRIVELHGGTVVAKSAGPGRGSEFVIELPAARQL
jgi:signal transduction histidine kinase